MPCSCESRRAKYVAAVLTIGPWAWAGAPQTHACAVFFLRKLPHLLSPPSSAPVVSEEKSQSRSRRSKQKNPRMFYSHQLLARKAPLGQIWMAATMHAKINRKKLCKLNIIKIWSASSIPVLLLGSLSITFFEEILNPSVPMALRLSGILMGGVVIVYERKVKLLYDDVSRLLVELNEAWKIKAIPDPTVLPKGKTQARYEAVTLPEDCDMEFEHSMSFSAAAEELPRKGFRMQLDDVDEGYININPDDDGIPEKHHQADAANITLFDGLHASFQQEDLCKRFERKHVAHLGRFDVEGDDETQINFTPIDEGTGIPTTLVPSPPPPPDHHMEDQRQHQTESEQPREREKESPASGEDAKEQIQAKRKNNSKLPRLAMDEGLLIIQADVYHTWLQDASNIISKKPRQAKAFEDLGSEADSRTMEPPIEKLRANVKNLNLQVARDAFPTPESPVQDQGPAFIPKNQKSDFLLGDLNNTELLEETAPLPTPNLVIPDPTVDKVTQTIRTETITDVLRNVMIMYRHLKTHFDTLGAPEFESLNLLAAGMNKQRAAQLSSSMSGELVLLALPCSDSVCTIFLRKHSSFLNGYLVLCTVLATLDIVKVEQTVPYGDISISRGLKM
ncbi:hypothetical protein Taro_035907 [Colocasia esculenta]|uniref:Rad21/Rec8-like protein N-terminal domain-containing protein n=1 Tax=Colocasia esculenta TaxID=4460 RepID=A0A843WBU6_COLES|nr:hypothetical protein [Colocasia esculenta]